MQYPLSHVATLTAGLPVESRVKRGINGISSIDDLLVKVGILDNLNFIVWSKTKDGQKNQNKPQSMYKVITAGQKVTEEDSFTTVEDFERRRKEIALRIQEGG